MKLIIYIIMLACSAASTAQALLKPSDDIWKQIVERNALISGAFIEGDAEKIAENYMKNALMMPEHSTSRRGTEAITEYYASWLKAAKLNSFTKTIYEVQNLKDYALEIGTFTQNFTLQGGKPFEYKGKYMVLWRISTNMDTCWIEAEIWGANDYINDADFPAIKDTAIPEDEPDYNPVLTDEVKLRNGIIAKLVTERKGGEHAALFMPDAIYMTYYTPMLIGEEIKLYFVEHEKPGTLKIESIQINTNGVNETEGGLIIEYGSYKVDWSDGDAKGTVTGKSINVWKRDANGTLMMYRQMVNHN
jgi:ketosteroid isomerase-like protein